MLSHKAAYTFNDVLIVPKYSEIESRKHVDLSSVFGPFKLTLPIFSANMKSITEDNMAINMAAEGGMGILHRFCSIDDAVEQFVIAATETNHINDGNCYSVGVSIGVKEEDKKRFDALYVHGARIFCIDIAHGHCKLMKNMIEWINSKHLDDQFIIAGNVATPDGAEFLIDCGAEVVKVGIGPGSACRTRTNTGVGIPQLYALESIREKFNALRIIADGGMSTVGDIAKAMKFADGCMLGGMLAGTSETPGNVFTNDKGEFYKVYSGSASGENKVANGGANEFVEGVTKTVPFRGHVKQVLRHIKHGLQSSFGLVGANNLKEYQEKCEFIEIAAGGRIESKI